MSSQPSHTGEEVSTVATPISQTAIRRPLTAAPSSRTPPTDTTNSVEKARRLRNLAASATEDGKRKIDDVMRFRAAANKSQADSKFLNAKAEELQRQANSLENKPTGKNVSVVVSEKLSQLRQVRKHLNMAMGRRRRISRNARKLQEKISLLQLVLEDPKLSGGLRQECLKEIREATVGLGQPGANNSSNPAPTQEGLSTTQGAVSDAETDDLEILEDTPEVRALFGKEIEKDSTTLARAQPQDSSKLLSAKHDLQAEQQLRGELHASAALFHTQHKLRQEKELTAATALSQRLSKYRPTARDMALGLNWTLLSSKTVRDDLEREIQEGGNQPYIAGHVAVMYRKLAILCLFAQEHDAPPGALIDEVGALEDALIKAKPLVNPASVRDADDHLRRDDRRNSLHRTLGLDRPKAANLVLGQLNRKRKRVDYSTDSESGGSKQDIIALRVERHRMVEPRSHIPKTQHLTSGHPSPQAATLGPKLNKPQDPILPSTNSSNDSDGSKSLEERYTPNDNEFIGGLP